MIKNVVFDIGNVLVNFDWMGMIEKKGVPKQYREKLINAAFKNPDWIEFDRGVMSYQEVVDMFAKKDPSVAEWIHHCLDYPENMITKRDYAIFWIQSLKKRGYNVYCLSNFSPYVWEVSQKALDFMPYVDGAVISSDIHMVKPDREIYEYLLEKYSLKAQESVFIDDTQVNLDTAAELGFKVILFDERERVFTELEKMLGDQ